MASSRSRAASNVERIDQELLSALAGMAELSKNDEKRYRTAALEIYALELAHIDQQSHIRKDYREKIVDLAASVDHLKDES